MDIAGPAQQDTGSSLPAEQQHRPAEPVRTAQDCSPGLKGLADFERPPAVETLVAFHFHPLQNWKTPNFGLFWQEIKREYPDAQVRLAEGLRLELNSTLATIELSGDVPVRWWYVHKSGKRLIQVQTDSFIQNWRKQDATDAYLHYKDLRPAFQKSWNQFLRFLKRQRVEAPRVRECEVTYVNHIDRGEGWRSFADLANVLSVWRGKTSCGFLSTPELISMNVVCPMDEHSGRLQIMVQPGIRQVDARRTIQLTITATCKPASSKPVDLFKCLDLGRFVGPILSVGRIIPRKT